MERHNAVTVRFIYIVTEGGPSTSASDGKVGDEQVGDSVIEGVIEGSNVVEEEEIARRPRIARRPQMPTKAEVDAHMVLHSDYRDWCPDCVAGRGVSVICTGHPRTRNLDDHLGWTTHV